MVPIVLERSGFHIPLGFDRFGSGLPEQEHDEDGHGEGDQAARHADEHLLRGEAQRPQGHRLRVVHLVHYDFT